ncbi:MFS transporter [Chromobacterium sinusclupearum]|uniref:MFS transporter n=1 Tax=Chromobacterium sinusclupearum TaxID=2077146 RepID=A0A2K4MK54_9NEIS|nr:MFS transporter [Chromobacterium sinusclupearum]POA97125.1 MFS transporter [Chromobacterium sinusclupearum]
MNKTLTAPAADAPVMHTASSRRTIVAVSLGNWLELYDFTVFSFFAVLIGKLYFPSHSEYGSLLMALATFGIGFVMRPLGSVVIGRIADRAGRKPALTLTIWLMAGGTALIGLAPTYDSIGLLAPLLIVAGRLLQGFAAGGEVGAATSFLMESGARNRRGFMVSWQMATQGGAVLAGALSGALLTYFLSHEALESWGWRLPFLLGLLVGPVGLYIRRHLDETHQAEPAEQPSLAALMRQHRRKLLLGCMLIMGGTANMYVVAHYLPSYLIKVLHQPPASALLAGCAAGLVLLLASPLAGMLADRLTRRKPLLLAVNALCVLLTLPCFMLLHAAPSLPAALMLALTLTALLALGSPAGFLLIMEAFPRGCRATGLAIIYACGVTLFGGFAQFIVTWLISVSGNPFAPAWYIMACSAASWLALLAFKEEAATD